ncbi:MAG: ferrous iron transport protein A [Synergistaceae bacterium]|jgi:ferrous iron transport protein A|nr:ferrous iron transport protein A [Synergistaceae bacterium]
MLPLAAVPIGSEVTVAKVSAEEKVKKHLEDLGILAGQTITPMSDSMGNTVLKVRESRLVINQGLARKIFVQE